MKLDKESIIGLTICGILLVGWMIYFTPKTAYPGKTAQTENSKIEKEKETGTPETTGALETGESPVQTQSPKAVLEEIKKPADTIKKLPEHILSNEFAEISIDPMRGCVSSILLKKYLDAAKKNNIILENDADSGALELSSKDKWKLLNIDCKQTSNNSIKLRREFQKDQELFAVTQDWKLKNNYTISYGLEIENISPKEISFSELKISAGGLPPIKILSGDEITNEIHNIDTCITANNTIISKKAQEVPGFFSRFSGNKSSKVKKGFEEIQENDAKWIAVTNKYFICILIPDVPFAKGNIMQSKKISLSGEKAGEDYFLAKNIGRFADIKLSPGKKFMREFTYYAGPKELALLKELDTEAPKIMYLAMWNWLEGISQALLKGLLWLKRFCGNYGLGIILLTLIVKLLFWPITHRSNVSMRKMQMIQPEVQEIRKKYQKDPQKMNTQIMQLYKTHKVNPLGGCFPILLQLPVFFALYSTLNGAIELRQSAFLWAGDLSKPDTVATIPIFGGIAVNPLILAMVITMIIQQKMTPSAADPAQQKMMMIMPLVMLIFLYSLPSGLTLYWTVSQIISIIQLITNKKFEKKEKLQPVKAGG